MLSEVFQRKIGSIAPTKASGTEPSRMMNGSRKLLNCAASTRKINTSASTSAAFHNACAFVAELTGLAAVVDRVAGRQNLGGLRLELLQRSVDAGADAGDLDRIELLEPVERARLHRFA
jgi:hypothetical protein